MIQITREFARAVAAEYFSGRIINSVTPVWRHAWESWQGAIPEQIIPGEDIVSSDEDVIYVGSLTYQGTCQVVLARHDWDEGYLTNFYSLTTDSGGDGHALTIAVVLNQIVIGGGLSMNWTFLGYKVRVNPV